MLHHARGGETVCNGLPYLETFLLVRPYSEARIVLYVKNWLSRVSSADLGSTSAPVGGYTPHGGWLSP